MSERCDFSINPFAEEGEDEQCPVPAVMATMFRRKHDGHQAMSFRCMDHWNVTNEAWEVLEGRFLHPK